MSHVWTPSQVKFSICRGAAESCHTCERVMAHVWISHVTHVNEPRRTYECVMSHIWMNHFTYMDESCHTHEWVVAHICMRRIDHTHTHTHTHTHMSRRTRRVPHSNKSCHTYACAISITKNFVPESFHKLKKKTHEPCRAQCGITYTCMGHVTHTNAPYRSVEVLCLSHVTNMNEPRRTYGWVVLRTMRRCLLHTHVCVMSHICMSHVARTNESCRTYEWGMSHAWIRHVAHTNVSCHTYAWAILITRSSLPGSRHKYAWVVSRTMGHVIHTNVPNHTYEWAMSISNTSLFRSHVNIDI